MPKKNNNQTKRKKAKRPENFFQTIGSKGGKSTLKKHGQKHMAKLAKKGGMATRAKFYQMRGHAGTPAE
jgi:general stress protein YciG